MALLLFFKAPVVLSDTANVFESTTWIRGMGRTEPSAATATDATLYALTKVAGSVADATDAASTAATQSLELADSAAATDFVSPVSNTAADWPRVIGVLIGAG